LARKLGKSPPELRVSVDLFMVNALSICIG
jgi:hypothetical protein